jgi:hypothetical protein
MLRADSRCDVARRQPGLHYEDTIAAGGQDERAVEVLTREAPGRIRICSVSTSPSTGTLANALGPKAGIERGSCTPAETRPLPHRETLSRAARPARNHRGCFVTEIVRWRPSDRRSHSNQASMPRPDASPRRHSSRKRRGGAVVLPHDEPGGDRRRLALPHRARRWPTSSFISFTRRL